MLTSDYDPKALISLAVGGWSLRPSEMTQYSHINLRAKCLSPYVFIPHIFFQTVYWCVSTNWGGVH